MSASDLFLPLGSIVIIPCFLLIDAGRCLISSSTLIIEPLTRPSQAPSSSPLHSLAIESSSTRLPRLIWLANSLPEVLVILHRRKDIKVNQNIGIDDVFSHRLDLS